MKAIGYKNAGPIDQTNALQDINLTAPQAEGRDILVEVRAISVNPVDTKIRQNVDAIGDDFKVIGWDAAGVVKAVGPDVTLFQPGDEVWYAGDLTRSGSNAQLQLVDERIVAKKPASLGFAEAAALPLTALTAYEMLFDRLEVRRDKPEVLLVIGAAGGVGSIMVQLARQLTGLTVVGTASRPESTQWLKDLGAHEVINHRNPLSEELAAIGIEQANYVVSLNGTEQHFDEIVKLIAPQGKFGLIDDPSTLNVMPFKRKSVSTHWEFMYTRSMFGTEDMQEQHKLLSHVAELVDAGQIKTTVANHYGTINAENLIRAHKALESGAVIGKIVLEGFAE